MRIRNSWPSSAMCIKTPLEKLSQSHAHPNRRQPEQHTAQGINKCQPHLSIPQERECLEREAGKGGVSAQYPGQKGYAHSRRNEHSRLEQFGENPDDKTSRYVDEEIG